MVGQRGFAERDERFDNAAQLFIFGSVVRITFKRSNAVERLRSIVSTMPGWWLSLRSP